MAGQERTGGEEKVGLGRRKRLVVVIVLVVLLNVLVVVLVVSYLALRGCRRPPFT